MRTFDITRPDYSILEAVNERIDNLNKPKGSLGVLENVARQICLIQQTLEPRLVHPCHLLFGADHGIEREGVSASPRDVTWQQMVNFTCGGGGVNMFCRQHGFSLRIIDVGVDHDLSAVPGIINRKIARGTQDFLHGPAMTNEQFCQAIEIGVEQTDDCIDEGCNILCVGEMGIGNTSASSLWMSIFGRVPLDECIGAGSGLDGTGLQHKREILTRALSAAPQTADMMAYFGGLEMVAAVGAFLRAAERHAIIMVDGFIMSACMLVASTLYPDVLHYAIFGHCGDEHGHRKLLDIMGVNGRAKLALHCLSGDHNAAIKRVQSKLAWGLPSVSRVNEVKGTPLQRYAPTTFTDGGRPQGYAPTTLQPLLSLGLRLGEGTGALCAYPLIDSAVRMMNEMNTFDKAKITKYF